MECWKRNLAAKGALSPALPRGDQADYLLGLKDALHRLPKQEERTH